MGAVPHAVPIPPHAVLPQNLANLCWEQSPCGPIPHNMAQGFDAPPTIKRSGSEHRRAVTSPLPEEEGLGEKVEPSLAKEGRGDSKKYSTGGRFSSSSLRGNAYVMKFFI